jgi:AraC-like DNA-binding protein
VSRRTIQEEPEHQQIRPPWLLTIQTTCHHVLTRLPTCDRNDARDLLKAFTSNLRLPENEAEWLVLRGLILEVVVRTSATQHGKFHTNGSERCNLHLENLLDIVALAPLESTIDHFESWQQAFFKALDLAHPATLGSSIGLLVRRDFKSRWNLARLATHFKTTPSTIRKSFRRKFGRSVHEYQQLARIVASLDAVRSTKVEPIARGVGYHSTKNFYNAFRRLIGRTPKEYRMLTEEEASLLKTAASQQLTRESQSKRASIRLKE